MHIYPEPEVRAAWSKVLATRERVARGVADWSEIAEHFTEDAIYIDPVWGRYVGRDAIASFMHECMIGFDDWRFPTLWTVVKDNLVICAFWSRVPGRLPDGGFRTASHSASRSTPETVNSAMRTMYSIWWNLPI